jgi:predicted permease
VRTATASNLPLVAYYVNSSNVVVPGRTAQAGDQYADMLNIDPSFLATMQIPILLGRDLQQGDLAQPMVAVINQKFASLFFGESNPVGRQFALGKDTSFIEVVGVSKVAHYNSLQETEQAVVYIPYTQNLANLSQLVFELRTVGPPTSAATAVRRIVHDASPSVSIGSINTQAQSIEQTISQQRTFANLGTCFAVLALLIACVGLYGAMAYTVARRTGEIGIRMALGAQRRGIIWMVLREVITLASIGLIVGYVAARFTTHFVESFLYGLKPNDPLAIAGAIAILLGAAVMAGYLPAWRASRIDPASALRNE